MLNLTYLIVLGLTGYQVMNTSDRSNDVELKRYTFLAENQKYLNNDEININSQ